MAALQRFRTKDVDALVKWYVRHQREFPWRKNPHPYWVWLAEIMSQQTQMATLVPYFHRFIEKFPTVEDLAKASEPEVLSAWTGLGYYSRARNIHAAAQAIVRAGGFPKAFDDWLELPGVGPYTAAAIVSQCFGVEEPVWDGNVMRVCSRLDARADVFTNAFRTEMTESLRARIKGRNTSHFNQAMMELGATICTPRAPLCGKCVLQKSCGAFATNSVDQFPPPKPRKTGVELKPKVWVRVRETKSGGIECLLERRSDDLWFGGMWDFPSELGGSKKPLLALEHTTSEYERFGTVRHQITHHKILLEGRVKLESKSSKLSKTSQSQWLDLDELCSDRPPVPLSTTARKILRPLVEWTKTQQLCLNTA